MARPNAVRIGLGALSAGLCGRDRRSPMSTGRVESEREALLDNVTVRG